MKVGDLVVYCESVTGVITGWDIAPCGSLNPIEVKVLLSDSVCEEWVDREALRVISESR
jgi:hypothetical protein